MIWVQQLSPSLIYMIYVKIFLPVQWAYLDCVELLSAAVTWADQTSGTSDTQAFLNYFGGKCRAGHPLKARGGVWAGPPLCFYVSTPSVPTSMLALNRQHVTFKPLCLLSQRFQVPLERHFHLKQKWHLCCCVGVQTQRRKELKDRPLWG